MQTLLSRTVLFTKEEHLLGQNQPPEVILRNKIHDLIYTMGVKEIKDKEKLHFLVSNL